MHELKADKLTNTTSATSKGAAETLACARYPYSLKAGPHLQPWSSLETAVVEHGLAVCRREVPAERLSLEDSRMDPIRLLDIGAKGLLVPIEGRQQVELQLSRLVVGPFELPVRRLFQKRSACFHSLARDVELLD